MFRLVFGATLLASVLAGFVACADKFVAAGGSDAGEVASSSISGQAPPTPPVDASSSSGNYAPAFVPSWEGNQDGGLPVPLTNSCAGVGSGGDGQLAGGYQAVAGCFDRRVFGEFFQQYCAGIEVRNGAGLVNSQLSVTSNTLIRSGDFKLAGEIFAPCLAQAEGSGVKDCAQLETALRLLAARGGAGFQYTLACYDEPGRPDACVCQMELAGDYPDDPFTIDTASRSMSDGSRVLKYGPAQPASLTRVVRTDDADAVPLENALVLDYLPE